MNHTKIRRLIRETGRTVIGVIDGDPPFFYTIGNHSKRMPEILVVGNLRPEHHSIINIASRLQLSRGNAFNHNEVVSLGEGAKFPVKFVDATCLQVKSEYTVQVGQYYRTEGYEVRQMLLPDKEGRFPGDPLCAAPYNTQIVFSAREPNTLIEEDPPKVIPIREWLWRSKSVE